MSLLLRGTTLPSVRVALWEQSLAHTDPQTMPRRSPRQHRLANGPSGGGTGLETMSWPRVEVTTRDKVLS